MCPGGASFTTALMVTLPIECSLYVNNTDSTRQAYNQNGGTSCDDVVFPVSTWVRFIGGSGSLLANCPVPFRHCRATTPGWYSGTYPSVAGTTSTGIVCFNWGTDTCMWNISISVINCNGFYIFDLSPPPICDARFCTI